MPHEPAETLRLSAAPAAGEPVLPGGSRKQQSESRGRHEPSERHHDPHKERRVRELFDRYYDLVWRVARRMGAPEEAADDAAQQVFIVASDKLDRIEAGKERSYLFGTAMRVAANLRRRSEPPVALAVEATADSAPGPELQADQAQQRRVLDAILATLSEDCRAVFVLYEIEGLTMIEIAETLALPQGTVASRLRRAREQFEQAVRRYQSSAKEGGR